MKTQLIIFGLLVVGVSVCLADGRKLEAAACSGKKAGDPCSYSDKNNYSGYCIHPFGILYCKATS